MSVATFIPKVWDARLLYNLDKVHIAPRLVNRDYEGEIKEKGDTVHINSIGPVTIKTYTSNKDIEDPEELKTDDQTLVINQAKYFNFQIDDVDAAQAEVTLMDKAMQRAAYGLAGVSDAFLFKTMADGADSGNVIAESSPVTKANLYDKIVDLSVLMDEANVPTVGRSLVIPPAAHGILRLDDRFIKASNPQTADEALLNGKVGYAAGFTIYKSNNLPNAGGTISMIASVDFATTFAEQIVKTEAYRMEKRFSDAVKGLHVYGAKVTHPKALAVLKAKVRPEAQ